MKTKHKYHESKYITLAKYSLFAMLITLIVMHILFQYLKINNPDSAFIYDLSNRFNVDDEVSLPSWYQASLLLATSFLAFWHSFNIKKHVSKWRFFAGILLLMSIDEGSGFHELIITPIRDSLNINSGSFFYNSWIIVGVFVVAILGIYLLKFMKILRPKSRLLIALGFVSFVMGILVLEGIGGIFVENDQLYTTWIVLIEEAFEIFGLSLVTLAVLNEIDQN